MKKLLFTLASVLPVLLWGQVAVSPSFNSNMVLQREMPLPVWGTADPGEKVTVIFGKQQHSVITGKDGRWQVKLTPMKASAEPQKLLIKGKENTIEFNNILVGEVWLCSGQSNMQMPMWTTNPRWRATDGDKHVKDGVNKLIRIVTVRPHVWAVMPQKFHRLNWEELDEKNGLSFSATAFYFGQELYRALKVPVGLISSNWGGTRIEPWTPPEGFNSVPQLAQIAYEVNSKLPGTAEYRRNGEKVVAMYEKWLKEFQAAVAAGKPQPQPPVYPAELIPYNGLQKPTVLYNTMIHALIPLSFRGAIWYQGCSNVADGEIYRYKMQALLNGWRKVFNYPEMPFYFVQLAPCGYSGSPYRLPVIWEAQQKFAQDNDDQVQMAVINDVGDVGDIHPHDKKTVGKRLSLLALKYTYGKRELQADFPELASWKIEGSKFILDFKNVKTWKGTPYHFEVCDVMGQWFTGKVTMENTRLIVQAPQVAAPVQLRYLWHQAKAGILFNEAGLPLSAFRCGRKVGKADIIKYLTGKMKVIYRHNMLQTTPGHAPVKYLENHSAKYTGEVKKIAYLVELTPKNGEEQWVITIMDAFDKDARKIGVPVLKGGLSKACIVKNLQVYSNVPGVKTGIFADGNIEFWCCNFVRTNAAKIPGANSNIYDFGDAPDNQTVPGYGCMQIHNYRQKQTVFAYNNFHNHKKDIGIGNHSGVNKDWTFAGNSPDYKKAELTVLAEF